MSHPTYRNASGRPISLLNDTDETPAVDCHTTFTPYSPWTQSTQFTYRDSSVPNTPDLMRSHSYDSQASGHESPSTPSSAYHEPLWSAVEASKTFQAPTGSKNGPAHLYNGEVRPQLPPISSFADFSSNDSAYATKRRSYSGNEQQAQRLAEEMENMDYLRKCWEKQEQSTGQHAQSPAAMDDGIVLRGWQEPDQAMVQQHQAVAQQPQDEKPDSSKKGTKSKNATQKRYPCKDPTCERTFTTSGHASRHAKIHEGQKPIECTFEGCTKRFTRQDNMKQHLETHRKEKSRSSARQNSRPSLAQRRQSASSRASVRSFSMSGETPPLMSPALASGVLMSPALSSAGAPRPSVNSRTPSGLDTLALVAATEQATVEQHETMDRMKIDIYRMLQPTRNHTTSPRH